MLLDLGEGILDNVDVTDIHVHQVFLLLVVGGPFLESQLEKGNWVGELTGVAGLLLGSGLVHGLGLSLLHLGIVSLLQFVLK